MTSISLIIEYFSEDLGLQWGSTRLICTSNLYKTRLYFLGLWNGTALFTPDDVLCQDMWTGSGSGMGHS